MCRFAGNTEDRFSRIAAHMKITSSYFSFGLMPAQVLNVRSPLPPNQSASASLPLNTQGPVQKMEPLTTLQVMSARDVFEVFLSHDVVSGRDLMPCIKMDEPLVFNIWVLCEKTCLWGFANSEAADQPAHMRSLISAFRYSWKVSYLYLLLVKFQFSI